MNTSKIFYRNNLPHFTPIGATYFITFRLGDSLPQSVLWKMKKEFNENVERLKEENPSNLETLIYQEQKRFFGKYDAQLDNEPYGKCWFKKEEFASILVEQMKKNDGVLYDLQAFTVMPNHVHLLIDTMTQLVDENNFYSHELPMNFATLGDMMQGIKGASAYFCNRLIEKQGGQKVLPFLQHESYDHRVRDEKEWRRILAYILNNPVKARLVDNWQDWKFTYCKDIYLGRAFS